MVVRLVAWVSEVDYVRIMVIVITVWHAPCGGVSFSERIPEVRELGYHLRLMQCGQKLSPKQVSRLSPATSRTMFAPSPPRTSSCFLPAPPPTTQSRICGLKRENAV